MIDPQWLKTRADARGVCPRPGSAETPEGSVPIQFWNAQSASSDASAPSRARTAMA